jgi:hypothetical protein
MKVNEHNDVIFTKKDPAVMCVRPCVSDCAVGMTCIVFEGNKKVGQILF